MMSNNRNYFNNDSHWRVEIPIWIPGFRGEFAYGEVSLQGADGSEPDPVNPIEPEPEPPDDGDIFSRFFSKSTFLRFFFIGRFAYETDRIIIQLDAFSGGIGDNITFRLNKRQIATVAYTTAMSRLFVGYAFYERYNKSKNLKLSIYGYGGTNVYWVDLFTEFARIRPKLDVNFFWAQPLIGLQSRFALKDWLFILQGDTGGHLSKSNYSYMIHVLIYYRISNLISIKFGWTDWDVNHKRTVLKEELVLNVHLSGPNTGIIFHF